MKKLLITTFFLISIITFGQTKEELIDAIIKNNSLDGDDGMFDSEFDDETTKTKKISSNNFENFEELKKLISKDELINLTNHKNQDLRLYSIRELIKQNDNSINIVKIILDEIQNETYIQTHEGCIISEDLTYSIIYHDYWNQVRLNALKKFNENDDEKRELIMQKAQENDNLLKNINNEIIKLNKDVYWLIYARIFEIKKYDENSKSYITKLLFENNNSYAFDYLRQNYQNEFEQISKTYFENYFEKQNFETDNQVTYLFNFTEFAFQNNDKELIARIIKKLKNSEGWRSKSGLFEYQIFEKYNVKI